MRKFDQGSAVRVTVYIEDLYQFSQYWPCSGMSDAKENLSLEFNKQNGDLIDIAGKSDDYDHNALAAVIDNAKKYARLG